MSVTKVPEPCVKPCVPHSMSKLLPSLVQPSVADTEVILVAVKFVGASQGIQAVVTAASLIQSPALPEMVLGPEPARYVQKFSKLQTEREVLPTIYNPKPLVDKIEAGSIFCNPEMSVRDGLYSITKSAPTLVRLLNPSRLIKFELELMRKYPPTLVRLLNRAGLVKLELELMYKYPPTLVKLLNPSRLVKLELELMYKYPPTLVRLLNPSRLGKLELEPMYKSPPTLVRLLNPSRLIKFELELMRKYPPTLV